MIRKILVAVTIAVALLPAPSLFAQDKAPLGKAASIKCTFPLMAAGTWGREKPEANVKPSSLTLQFDAINADEGTAELKSGFGKYDIVVRYAGGYLHFIQSFLDGPLYSTTILDKKTAGGKFKAMHSRHEHTDIALPGFTSTPEQYYGECEIVN